MRVGKVRIMARLLGLRWAEHFVPGRKNATVNEQSAFGGQKGTFGGTPVEATNRNRSRGRAARPKHSGDCSVHRWASLTLRLVELCAGQ